MTSPEQAVAAGGWAGFVSSPLATVLVTGPGGAITEANDSIRRLTDRSVEALREMRLADLIHPDDLRGLEGALDRWLAGIPGEAEVRCTRQDGSSVWCAVRTWPVGGDEGVPAERDGAASAVVCQFHDVSRRRAAEEQLLASEQRLRLLFENVEDYGIYFLDPDGRVASWNTGAERMEGYSADEIVGRHYRVFFTADDVAAGLPEENLKTAVRRRRAAGEGRRVRKDGSEFWASWSLTALYDGEEPLGFVKINRDVTELREARRELSAYAEQLREANQALVAAQELQNDILGVAHHELRTPLTAVIGFAETLRHAWTRLDRSEIDTALKAIETGGRRLQGLVENLLALSALQSASRSLRRETVHVATAVKDAAAMVGLDLAGVTFDVPDGLRVTADSMRVRQIVANLLSNAAIYGEPPVEVTAREADDVVELCVVDHGPGVPESFVPDLFARFSQASRGTTRTARGAGLGLAAVRELAEAQGGKARYEMNHPRGARFLVTLPRAGF